MAITLKENRQNLVIKRNGKEQPFDIEKIRKTLLWATNNDENMTNTILNNLELVIYNKIHVTTLFSEMQEVVNKLCSRITPKYFDVLKNLEVMRVRKEAGCTRHNYPHLIDHMEKVLDFLTTGERFNDLPQFVYMRAAIIPYLYDESKDKVEKIIRRYNNLSTHVYTEATPKMISGGHLIDFFNYFSDDEIEQLNDAIKEERDFDLDYIGIKVLLEKYQIKNSRTYASCVVHKMDDNSESINRVVSDIGLWSRAGGGNSVDITSIRSEGSLIGFDGESKGKLPVASLVQAIIRLYNQRGMRKGACTIYMAWYDYDIFKFLKLLDEGGLDDERARDLKLGTKINNILLEKYQNGEDVYLFDAKDVPLLHETYGEEFNTHYENYVKKGIYKKVIKAKDLLYEIALTRAETGNNYIFFTDIANEYNIFKDFIYSSNLCSEIYLPTRATVELKKELQLNIDDNKLPKINETYESGLTAICNLSSINLPKWYYLSKDKKVEVAKELLEASDNLIEIMEYPTKEGELFNRGFRAIGIGQAGQALLFAKEGINWDSQEADEIVKNIAVEMHEIFNQESEKLAKIRGSFKFIDKTKHNIPKRFATLFAIAPTSTSSIHAKTTEGIEPVKKIEYTKSGDGYKTKVLVPNANEYHYEIAKDIPTRALLRLASIRQKYMLDQGQSISLYTKDPSSAKEIIDSFIMAIEYKLKGLYYLVGETSNSENSDEKDDDCLSCHA